MEGSQGVDGPLGRLQAAAEACLAGRPDTPGESWTLSEDAGQGLTEAIASVMLDGLVGNRAVGPSLWAVLEALRRAHPLQLAPGVDSAKDSAAALGRSDEPFLVQMWIQQAVSRGNLADALAKLKGQPHIQGAFQKDSLLRQPAALRALSSTLLPLKGVEFARAPGLGMGAEEAEQPEEGYADTAAARSQHPEQGPVPSAPGKPEDAQPPAPPREGKGQEDAPQRSQGTQQEALFQEIERQREGGQGASGHRSVRAASGDPRPSSHLQGGVEAMGAEPGEQPTAMPVGALPAQDKAPLSPVPVLPGTGGSSGGGYSSQAALALDPHRLETEPSRGSGWMSGLFWRHSQDGGPPEKDEQPVEATAGLTGQSIPAAAPLRVLLTVHQGQGSAPPGVSLLVEPRTTSSHPGGHRLSEALQLLDAVEASGGSTEEASEAVHCARAALLADSLRDAAASVLQEALPPLNGAAGRLCAGSTRVEGLLLLMHQLLGHRLRKHPQRHGPFGLLHWGEETTAWAFLMAVEEGWGNHLQGKGLPLGCTKIQTALKGLPADQAGDERRVRLWLLHCLEQRRLYDHLCAITQLPKAALLAWYERSSLMLDADAMGPFLAMLAGLGAVEFDSEGQLDGVREALEAGTRLDIGQEQNPLVLGAQEAIRGVSGAVGGLFNKNRTAVDPRDRAVAEARGEFTPAVVRPTQDNPISAPPQASKIRQTVVEIGDGSAEPNLFTFLGMSSLGPGQTSLPMVGGKLEDLLSPTSSFPEVRMDRESGRAGDEPMPEPQGPRAWRMACGCLSLPIRSASGGSTDPPARGGPALSPVSKCEEDGPVLLDLLHSDTDDYDDDEGLVDVPDFLPTLPLVSASSGRGRTRSATGDMCHVLLGADEETPAEAVQPAGGGAVCMSRSSTALSERQEADTDWLSMGRVADASQAALWEQYGLPAGSGELAASAQEEAVVGDGVSAEATGWAIRGPRTQDRCANNAETLPPVPLAVRRQLPKGTEVQARSPNSSPGALSSPPSGLSAFTEEGDFCRLLSQEIPWSVAHRTRADSPHHQGQDGPLPEPRQELQTPSAVPGSQVPDPEELGIAVRALVAGVMQRVLAAAQGSAAETGSAVAPGRPGSRIQVMLWVDDDQQRVSLSLFLPREISAGSPERHASSVTSERSEGSTRDSESPAASLASQADSQHDVQRAPGHMAQPIACGPQKGTADDFRGIGALPRPAPVTGHAASGGLLLGAALMEGYAGVDNQTLQDMSHVLRDGHGLESHHRMLSGSDLDVLDPGLPPSTSAPSELAEGASHKQWSPKWVSVVRAESHEKAEGGNDYTVYVIHVVSRDGRQWMVEHRFRDFTKLRSALKYKGLGLLLPQCWGDISRARSVTGKHKLAPEVVEARRLMLDRCLSEAVEGPPGLSGAAPLLDFLAPPVGENAPEQTSSSAAGGPSPEHHQWSPAPWISAQADKRRPEVGATGGGELAEASEAGSGGDESFGSSVRLVLSPPESLSGAELMRRQGGNCAACRKQIPMPKGGLLSGLGLSISSGSTGPRKCEYSGRLYCPKCFGNSSAILPARVLHGWDFKPYPVSSIAAEFLSSIYEQPMLCIGAVNPGLYARVPLLARVHEKRIVATKAVELVVSRSSQGAQKAERLLKAAGVRRYLLEGPEFWAMRELIELSKGAFSDLPAWLDNIADRASSLALSSIVGREPQ